MFINEIDTFMYILNFLNKFKTKNANRQFLYLHAAI